MEIDYQTYKNEKEVFESIFFSEVKLPIHSEIYEQSKEVADHYRHERRFKRDRYLMFLGFVAGVKVASAIKLSDLRKQLEREIEQERQKEITAEIPENRKNGG